MFELLKKSMLEEIKQEIIKLKENKEKIQIEKKEHNDKEIEAIRINPLIDERVREFNSQYPKLSKIFNRKKYNRKLNELHALIQEEKESKIKKERALVNEINEKSITNDKEVEKILNILKQVESAKELEQLQISFDKAKELLANKGVDIFSYSYEEKGIKR